VMYGLAFLVMLLLSYCHRAPIRLELIWKNNRAVGISIPLKNYVLDSLKIVNVREILGSFAEHENWIEFKPTIPLTAGLSYEVWNGSRQIGKLTVPFPSGKLAPKLTAIYPERDTVPENLLKFYFVFSRPMRTGEALRHIFLIDQHKDTLKNVFLNVQPELWDTAGKVLTLWLDPGRIKRDLVLNKKLGNPLIRNANYEIKISSEWKDRNGLSLTKAYTKSFVVSAADHEMPDVKKWSFSVPDAGSKQAFIIDAKAALDHFLFAETITILNQENKIVEGQVRIIKDQVWEFIPKKMWNSGTYKVQVYTRLEDLAANNLNRVFDRDISKEKATYETIVVRSFQIK